MTGSFGLKIWLPAVLAVWGLFLSASQVRLPAGTPVFDAPKPGAGLLLVLPQNATIYPQHPPEQIWFRAHPLARRLDFYPVKLQNKTCFASPDISASRSTGKRKFELRMAHELPSVVRLLGPASAGTGLLLICRMIRTKKARQDWRIWAGVLIAARIALLAWIVDAGAGLYCNPADEPGYFEVAKDLLRGHLAGPWTYPVGHGALFMLPFAAAAGAQSYWDILIPASWFSGFVLGPLALVLGFRILMELKIPMKHAFAAMLLWALLPFFLHHTPDWENKVFHSFFDLPSIAASFRYYMTLIGCGFNGMSDMFSTVLVFAVILACLKIRPSLCSLALVSALLGVACLVRLNNIFFCPVAGYLLLLRFRENLTGVRQWTAFLLTGSLVFLAVTGIQLAVNFHQFGSMWIFPYSLHALNLPPGERPAAGFTFVTLVKGISLRYLLESNLFVMSSAISGFLLLPDREKRAVLGLWAIPVILFFCGYSHTFCDPVRFILSSFVPLLAAAVLAAGRLLRTNRLRLGIFCLLTAVLVILHSGVVLAVLLALISIRSIADAVITIFRHLQYARPGCIVSNQKK